MSAGISGYLRRAGAQNMDRSLWCRENSATSTLIPIVACFLITQNEFSRTFEAGDCRHWVSQILVQPLQSLRWLSVACLASHAHVAQRRSHRSIVRPQDPVIAIDIQVPSTSQYRGHHRCQGMANFNTRRSSEALTRLRFHVGRSSCPSRAS